MEFTTIKITPETIEDLFNEFKDIFTENTEEKLDDNDFYGTPATEPEVVSEPSKSLTTKFEDIMHNLLDGVLTNEIPIGVTDLETIYGVVYGLENSIEP